MARRPAPRASVREMVLTLLQRYDTQKKVAEVLGVSERTVRRWKNEGVQPVNPFVREYMQDEYGEVRNFIRRSNAGARAPNLNTPIPIKGTRRKLVVRDQEGNDTGLRKRSDWSNYDTSRLSEQDVLNTLTQLVAERGTVVVMMIYKVPKSPEYPKGKVATSPIELSDDMSDADIYDATLGAVSTSQVLFVGVLD